MHTWLQVAHFKVWIGYLVVHGEFTPPVLWLCSGVAVPQAPSGSFIDGTVVRLRHRFSHLIFVGWPCGPKHGVNPGSSPVWVELGGYIGVILEEWKIKCELLFRI